MEREDAKSEIHLEIDTRANAHISALRQHVRPNRRIYDIVIVDEASKDHTCF